MNDTENVQNLINERNNQNKRIEQLVLEIERLNNIIDELEKYLEEESKYDEYVDVFYREDMGNVLDKLKQLKEENNENKKIT